MLDRITQSTSFCELYTLSASQLQVGKGIISLKFFKKWANPGLFFVYFQSFQTNMITIFTTDQCEKMSCPSSIWRRDSNTQPSECQPPPITTRPGLLISSLTFLIKYTKYTFNVTSQSALQCGGIRCNQGSNHGALQ